MRIFRWIRGASQGLNKIALNQMEWKYKIV